MFSSVRENLVVPPDLAQQGQRVSMLTPMSERLYSRGVSSLDIVLHGLVFVVITSERRGLVERAVLVVVVGGAMASVEDRGGGLG